MRKSPGPDLGRIQPPEKLNDRMMKMPDGQDHWAFFGVDIIIQPGLILHVLD